MDMQNLLCKWAGELEAVKANTKTMDIFNNKANALYAKKLEEKIEELEEVSGIKAPVKQEHEKLVQIQHRQVAR